MDGAMLNQGDIDTLLAALVASQETGAGAAQTTHESYDEIKIYDFARPDNLPSEFLRALDNINASFARSLAGMLTGFLSAGAMVEPLSVDQMTYRQYCHSVPDVTALATFTIAPLVGTALFEMNPHLTWYLLDRGLGGDGEVLDAVREFTPLERGLLDDIFRRMLRELGKSWETLVPMKPVMRELLSNPTIARIAQPDDRMVVCSFNITLPGVMGVSTYCIPVSTLDFERLLSKDTPWDAPEEYIDPHLIPQEIYDALQQVPVPVRICLPDLQMRFREIVHLTEGDVLHLDARVDALVEVRVQNVTRFVARPITIRDAIAVELQEEMGEQHG